MIINRKLWVIYTRGGSYYVAAENFDQAVYLMKVWRPGIEITGVSSVKDSVVLVKEDVEQLLKE